MFSKLWQQIKGNPVSTGGIVLGILVLVISLRNTQWLGERATGVVIGASVVSLLILGSYLLDTLKSFDTLKYLTPSILVITVLVGIIIRVRTAGGLRSPLQLSVAIPSNQTILLGAFCIAVIALLIAFLRALHRGEGVSFESHWGGLGGGITGWRISSALIYLLGIVFLLLFSLVIAWRMFIQTSQASTATQSATTTQAH